MKSQMFNEISSVLYENRYCSQDKFDIAICGGHVNRGGTNEVIELKGPDFKTFTELSPMLTHRYLCKTAVIDSDIYVIGGYGINAGNVYSSEIYSKKTNQWKNQIPLSDKRIYFSVCSFMKYVYVVGGYLGDYDYKKGCFKYDKQHEKWTQIADLNKERCSSGCTVFEGKIVATGGHNYSGRIKSVESYDHYENKWISLSDMVEWKIKHSAVNMGNKLLVIDGERCSTSNEVYDNISRKFIVLNLERNCTQRGVLSRKSLGISNKIYIFCSYTFNYKIVMYVYNVDKNKWNSEEIVITDNLCPSAFQKYSKT